MADVQELEQKAKALVDQFLSQSQEESPPKELEDILKQLPSDKCHYERGVLAFRSGGVDEAIDLLCRAAVDEFGSMTEPISCNELRHRWVSPFAGDLEPKLWSRLADVVAAKWPGSAPHLLLQAYAALDQDDTKTGEELLTKCLDADESYWAAAMELGVICEERGEWEQAQAYHQRALSHASGKNRATPYLCLGICQLELGNSDAAISLFKKALDCNSDYWRAALELGNIYLSREEWSEASTYYEQVLQRLSGEDRADAYARLGMCQLGLDKPDQAIASCHKAIECDEKCWAAFLGLGGAYQRKGASEKASDCFERALRGAGDEQKTGIYYDLGLCRWDLQEVDVAIEYFVKALEADPKNWDAAAGLGDAYCETKNWKAARAYYERAAHHAKEDPTAEAAEKAYVYFALGFCCSKIKDQEGEEDAFRTCLELDPDFKYARNNLGWSLVKAGKLEEAVAVLREAIERGKDGKYPLRNLARALRKLGRYSEAIEVLQEDTYRGRLTKFAKTQTEELQALLEKQKQGEVIADEAADDLEEVNAESESEEEGPGRQEPDEESAQIEPTRRQRPAKKQAAQREPREVATRIHREDVLEALIERRIDRGQEVFGRRLRMFQANDSPLGRYGRQFAIPDVGRIDLLAVDVDSGDLVVIELKRDKPMRDTVGQLCLYKGWAEKNLAGEGQQVFGIICVWEATESLRLATHAVPGVDVFEYDLTFAKV